MEEFLTPQSSANPDEMRTPGTASEAASNSGGDGNNVGSAVSGKKRPAPSADSDDLDDDSVDNNTSFFSRLVSSVTPFGRKNRRARTSLDSMSGSAIKSASRLPASEDSDRSGSNGGSGKKSLEKLNLEHKFDSSSATDNTASVNGGNDVAAVPVQMANNINEQSARPAKRVRLAENPFASTTTNGNANNGEEAIKSVRIGGTTFVSSTTTTAATGHGNGPSVKFDDVTTAKFNIGTTKLKDVRGRNLTPARGLRSKWGTPSSRSSLPQDGMRSATSTAPSSINRRGGGGYQRRSIQGLSTTSRRGLNRRRGITSRSFKPMNNLLGQIHAPSTNNDEQSKKKLLISQNIADQILGDRRNKLFQSSVVDRKDNLFGIATSNNSSGTYKAVTNNAPRIRMNRVMGSGQTGSRFALPAPAATAATAMVTAVQNTASTTGVSGTTPSIPLQPSIAAKMTVPTSTSTLVASTNNALVAPNPTLNETALTAEVSTFVPFKPSGPISDLGEGETKLCALEADANLSQKTVDDFSEVTKNLEWTQETKSNDPFSNVGQATKPSKKRKTTSHPKKGSGSYTKLNSGSSGGAPFSFMPGGAAASSKVDTSAFNYKETKVLPSSTPAKPKTPAKSLVPAATDTSTKSVTTTTSSSSSWGDIFKNQGENWKCKACYTQNPMDKNQCMACETAREGCESKADAEPSGSKNDAVTKGSVGTGGFTFGAPSSSSAPAPAASTAGSIGAGGFSFSATSSSTSTSAPAIKFGATPSKTAEKKDDAKATTGATGFSFGGATPAKTKPSTSGFTFGATSTTESKNVESEEKKDDTPKKSSGFNFGASTAASSTPSKSKANATFSFDQSSESTGADENKGDTANTGGFNFGSSSSNPKPKRVRDDDNGKQDSAKKASSSSNIAFGSVSTDNKSAAPSTFQFGAGTKKEEAPPASTSTFSFGSTSTETKTNTSTAPFTFGSTQTPAPAAAAETKSASTSTAAPGFSFGQPAPSTNGEKDKPGFTFGQPISATSASEKKDISTPNPASTFAFGAAAQSTATATAAPTAPAPAGAFQFGSQTQTPAAAPFGGSGFGTTQQPAVQQPAAPAPAFGFSASAPTPAPVSTPASTFSFGGSAQAVAAPAPTPGFSFGASAAAPPPAFGMPPAATPAPAPVAPAFGMSAAAAPAPTGFGGGGFGMSQAPAPAMNGGGFSMGVGGGAKKAAGGRRIVRARRPPGSKR